MRKLIAAALLLTALILAPLLVLRSERALIALAYWAVGTFTDLRLELKSPVIRPFQSIVSAEQIHLYPKGESGPPFISVLGFDGDVDVRDFYLADLSRTRLNARSVVIYVSDRDQSADPVPLEWLQYLAWLPLELRVNTVHLVTESENTLIFPLVDLRGQRSDGDRFTAAARAHYDGEPLDFDLQLSALRDAVKFTGIDVNGSFIAPGSGSEVRLDGELRGTIEDFNYDFRLVGNYTDVNEFMRGFKRYHKLAGVLQLRARLHGNTDGFELSDAHFLLNNLPHYGIEAVGSLSYHQAHGSEIHLQASGELSSMETLIDWIDIDLKPLGRAQGNATLSGSIDQPVIDDFILHSESDEGLSVTVRGRIELQAAQGTDNRIAVDISGPELAVLEAWTGATPYEPGAFSASAELSGTREQITLERLVVDLGSTESVAARIEASAADIAGFADRGLGAVEDVDLVLKLVSPDTGHVAALLDLPIPGGLELGGELRLQGSGDRLEPAGGSLHVDSSDVSATLTPTSGVFNAGASKPLQGLQADITLDMSDTSALSQFMPWAVPALGPVTAGGSLVQEGDRFSLRDIELAITGDGLLLRGKGSVGDVRTLSDTRIMHTFSGVEPRDLLFALFEDFTYPQALGGLGGTFTLTGKGSAWNLRDIAIASEDQDGPLYLRLEGDIDDLAGLPKANLNGWHNIREPALLEALTGLRMNPSEGITQIRASPGKLDLRNSTRFGETHLDTVASLRHQGGELTGLELAVDSKELFLGDVGLQAGASAEVSYNPSERLDDVEPEARFEKLLQRSPRMPTDIRVNIDGITGENTSIDSLALHMTGLDNRYTLRQFSVGYDETMGELRGIIDLNAKPPFVSVAGEALAVPLNTLGRDLGRKSDIKGQVTLRGGLSAQGYSGAELLKDVDGSLAIALENAEIEGAAYDVLATDLLEWIYSGASLEKSTHIDCTMGQFALLDGVASSDSLYIETRKMVATGSARVDMVQEKLDITITPRSKTRQLQVPSSVRLRGSFDDPRVTISPVAAAFDAYAEFITLLPRTILKIFGAKRSDRKSRRPCEAVN